ncbi:MAG: hypothetical protein M1829_005358 [Trizodia sp. TS-e1964]|nr:MAG: hypothetical protein M1829_005358 [Trizodia sp. TS-e1964]
MPRIQNTGYRILSETRELSRNIVEVSGNAGLRNGYRFLIFSFEGVVYELFLGQTLECLLGVINKMEVDMPGVEIAGSHYMCMNKCAIEDAAGKTLVPQTSVLPSRKISGSLPSPAGHSPEMQNSGSIPASLARVASGVFYLLGQMATRSKEGDRARLPDYHVLVSLDDFSVWIQYCAWEARFILEDGCPEDEWGFKEPFSPFKLDDDTDWARLSGYQPRVLMARVAERVRSWQFSGGELAVSEIWSDDLVVPATSGAVIKSNRVINPS